MKRYLFLAVVLICSILPLRAQESDTFAWRNATVYFLITDRFYNGDPSNDQNYGRRNDYGSEQLNAATFHGGDFTGVLEKAREGYFQKMGVDVVWMTDVYEQIHGWLVGSGSVNDFPHYGYPTLLDAVQYGFADVDLTEEEAVEHIRTWSYDQFFANRLQWRGWYDRSWIRMPDYKEESVDKVRIPEFLKHKWRSEGKKNDA